MKKLSVLLTMIVCAALNVRAQYYHIPFPNANTNPGAINTDAEYPSGGGLPAGWTIIGNPSASPVWSANQSLPFSFNFNGAPVTSYKVSNSGVLTFDVGTAVAAPASNRFARAPLRPTIPFRVLLRLLLQTTPLRSRIYT